MANQKNRKLTAKIINIEADPLHKGRTIVSVRFTDQKSGDEWTQGFSLLPDRPISLEEFILNLKSRELAPPVDPFQYLKDAQNKPFELDLGSEPLPE